MPLFTGSQARIHYEQAGDGPDIVWVAGAGGTAASWEKYQLPFFTRCFRNTTFDARGVGATVCEAALPWPIEDFARDTAELIAAVCDPPVALVGLSFGAGVVQQVALDYPGLLSCAIAMGTGARSVGWTWDYQMAEIEWRRAGGRLDGMMAVTHYAAMYYPARVLGDRELWPRLRDELLEYYETDTAEESLIAQWEPCVRFDQTDRLPECRVPLHVVAFDQDVQAVPQDGEEVAALCPSAEYHLFEGMGHCSIYGHAHDVLNPFIKRLVESHLRADERTHAEG
jgi:pimeloyl-ACP methyl ester carboxylesterase